MPIGYNFYLFCTFGMEPNPFTSRGPRRRSEAWGKAGEVEDEAREIKKAKGTRPSTSPHTPHPVSIGAELMRLAPKLFQAVAATSKTDALEDFDTTDLDHSQRHFDAAWEAANAITDLKKSFDELSTASLQYTELVAFVHEETKHGKQVMENNF